MSASRGGPGRAGSLSGGLNRWAEESLALCRELGSKYLLVSVLIGLGYIAQRQGDGGRARACFEESLARSRETGSLPNLTRSLGALAGVAGMQGQPIRGARLFGAAEVLTEAFQQQHPAGHRIERERNVALTRAQLDAATFEAAWAAGRALSLEQAIAEATAEEA